MIKINAVGEKQIIVELGENEEDVMKQMALIALENNNYNITQTAKALGLKRSCLSMRLKKWNLFELMKDSTIYQTSKYASYQKQAF